MVAAIDALRSVDSWTGRIHVHKHLFITQVLGLAKPPFEFELYQYGPYSFGLDRKIAELEAYGMLTKEYEQPGYGARYMATEASKSLIKELSSKLLNVIRRVAEAVGKEDSKKLELIATCLWVERREGVRDEDKLADVVRNIKPRYTRDQIVRANKQAHKLEQQLCEPV